MPDAIVLIPARMASTRLPGKPLADIDGVPMIVHVLRRAQAAAIGEVVVATDSEAVAGGGGKSRRPRGHDAQRSRVRLGPHLRGARSARPGAPHRHRGQRAGRPADHRRPATSAPRSSRSPTRGRHRDACRRHHRSGRAHQSECRQGVGLAGRARPAARAQLHPRRRDRRRPALSPHRALRLSPRRAGTIRQAAAVGQRATRKARAVARARRRHAHRRRDR